MNCKNNIIFPLLASILIWTGMMVSFISVEGKPVFIKMFFLFVKIFIVKLLLNYYLDNA